MFVAGEGDLDLDRPNVGRMFDYYLGGDKNWAMDRERGNDILSRFPRLRDIVQVNRNFHSRVVRHLTKRGIRQFLDIGAGGLTAPSVHEVADTVMIDQGDDPSVRVIYVDHEPVAVSHAEMVLWNDGDADRHGVIHADLCDTDALWEQIVKTDLIDANAPIAVLLTAVLQDCEVDSQGRNLGGRAVARLCDRVPDGSYMAISCITDDGVPIGLRKRLAALKHTYDYVTSSNVTWCSRDDISAMLHNLHLIEPGWTWAPDWHPEEAASDEPVIRFPAANHSAMWSGVAQAGRH